MIREAAQGEKPDSMTLRGAICGIVGVLCLWLIIAVFMLTDAAATQRLLGVIAAGIWFWMFVWALGGFIIGAFSRATSKAVIVGMIYGAIVGAATGAVLVSAGYCSQVVDPTPQIIILGVGLPAIIFHSFVFGWSGLENSNAAGLFSCVTFWSLFGLIVSKIISRTTNYRLINPS